VFGNIICEKCHIWHVAILRNVALLALVSEHWISHL